MCGIFGFVISRPFDWQPKQINTIIKRLCLLSETRGKDASGLIIGTEHTISVLKRPVRAKELINTREFEKFSKHLKDATAKNSPLFVMGHTRMVTNGNAETHENNQPIIKEDITCIHNGIIVNDNALWEKHPELERQYEVDTEIVLSLLSQKLQMGEALIPALQSVYKEIKGANSLAVLPAKINAIVLATSNGSLFTGKAKDHSIVSFASEKYILSQVIRHSEIKDRFRGVRIEQLKPGTGCSIDTGSDKIKVNRFELNPENHCVTHFSKNDDRSIIDLSPSQSASVPPIRASCSYSYAELEKLCSIDYQRIFSLKRCTKCLLPETFPFISYDQDGVCNYCHNYVYWNKKPVEELHSILEPVRKKDGNPDCLVPISGGRDSSYALHYIVRELKMHPVAYTYDWGMVTDLARRNISRMCGALGIEHILVSADIAQKRANIKKNVLAWLKKPHLGSVTLFMAGDKPYFYYAYMLRRQMNLKISLLGDNHLENTDFKVGFCNIEKSSKGKQHFQLSPVNKLQLCSFFGKRFFENPSYINSTLIDSLLGFASYYILPADYLSVYDYIQWDENNISKILIGEYDWEVAKDTDSTWRIGDGTASFYNYIYYKVAGFSENDTFRSNQIREGVLDRETAMKITNIDNRPRVESIKWYCDTIGIDCKKAIKRINEIPTLY